MESVQKDAADRIAASAHVEIWTTTALDLSSLSARWNTVRTDEGMEEARL